MRRLVPVIGKRMACGYRNRERFRRAIYSPCGNLDLYPETACHMKELSAPHFPKKQICGLIFHWECVIFGLFP